MVADTPDFVTVVVAVVADNPDIRFSVAVDVPDTRYFVAVLHLQLDAIHTGCSYQMPR